MEVGQEVAHNIKTKPQRTQSVYTERTKFFCLSALDQLVYRLVSSPTEKSTIGAAIALRPATLFSTDQVSDTTTASMLLLAGCKSLF